MTTTLVHKGHVQTLATPIDGTIEFFLHLG